MYGCFTLTITTVKRPYTIGVKYYTSQTKSLSRKLHLLRTPFRTVDYGLNSTCMTHSPNCVYYVTVTMHSVTPMVVHCTSRFVIPRFTTSVCPVSRSTYVMICYFVENLSRGCGKRGYSDYPLMYFVSFLWRKNEQNAALYVRHIHLGSNMY